MSLKSLTLLVDEVRESAEEKDFSATTGLQDDEIIRFLNQGKNIIYRKIIKKSQKLFTKSINIPLVANQKEVDMPKDIYAQNRLADIKYLRDNYIYQVYSASEKEDLYMQSSIPYKYYRNNNKIVLIPATDAAAVLKVIYIYKLPTLGFKAARVSAVTTLDGAITSLFFDIASDSIDSLSLNKYTQFSVVDRDGNVKMSNIPFDLIDTTTGEVTVTAGFEFSDVESISIGDTVVAGPLSSTHTGLEEDIEEYAVEYAIFKCLQRQSSQETGLQAQVVLALETDIMDVYGKIEDDITEIPQLESSTDSEDGDY